MKANSTTSRKIHDLLEHTLISGEAMSAWLNGEENKMVMQLQPISTYLLANAPKKLYRMRAYNDRTIKALKEDKLYFSRADWFNDPYDCLLYFDQKEIRKRLEKMFSDESLRAGLEQSGMQFPLPGVARSKEEYIRKFGLIRSEIIDNMCGKQMDAVAMLQKTTFIICFCETVLSPIMWSHYSDNHKGFAIEFEFEPNCFAPTPYTSRDSNTMMYGWTSLLPVFYSKQRADATELAKLYCMCETRDRFRTKAERWIEGLFLPDMLLRTKLSLEKSESWAYEREWRMIETREWPNDIVNTNAPRNKKAAAIYLGERMLQDHKDELIQIARDKNIPVYEMYIDYASKEYAMKYREIK